MPDFGGAPVATAIHGPQAGIQTLSALMGLKQQQLGIARAQIGLQQQQQELSSQASAATVAAINAKQQTALSQIDWKQYVKPDGSYDVQGATQAALQAAPNVGPEFVDRLETMAAHGADAKKAFFGLNQDYQQSVRAAFGSWAADPKGTLPDLAAQLQAIQADAPADTQQDVGQIIKSTLGIMAGPNLITGAPKTLAQQKAAALAYSRAGLTPPEVSGTAGLATPAAGTVSTGTQVLPTTTNRMTGVTQAANAPAVAALSQLVTLPNGQTAVLDLRKGTFRLVGGSGAAAPAPPAATGAPAAPAAAARGTASRQPALASQPAVLTAENDPARPSANAPTALWSAWTQNVAHTQAEVQGTRQADANYGNQMAIASEVRDLADVSKTGPGTPEWTRLVGAITSRFGGSSGITNVQTLESFLDRQAASMRSAMGLPATNAGQETAQIVGGNIGMQRGAVQAKNDYNEALAQGLHDYRRGLDRVAGFGGNASPTAVNRFRAAWAQSFNPLGYEYKLAAQRRDSRMEKAILSHISPDQAETMLRDLRATDQLLKGVFPSGR